MKAQWSSFLLFVVAGCTPSSAQRASTTAAAATGPTCDVARDREAIKQMAGTFDITFDFQETDVLTPGYQPRAGDITDARELVEVLADSERFVSIQHTLVLRDGGGNVTPQKHWRQDWRFEDTSVLEFRGHDTFERRSLPAADVKCAWSQAVFEVTDAPRYESVGRWVHGASESTWTSGVTWRPLPRREYTKRSDYDVLIGINRHIVRKDGWTHDQNNEKRVLATGKSLVKERGQNRYVRAEVAGADVAREYMKKTGPFWSKVRGEWATIERDHAKFVLLPKVEGKALYEVLFPLADELAVDRAHGAIAAYIK